MLLSAFDDSAAYDVLGDDRQGLHILLVRRAEIARGGLVNPLYVFPCADENSYLAALRWFAVRRHLWQSWGELGERSGNQALVDHIEALLTDEPIGLVPYSIVQGDAEPKVLCLGDVVQTPTGMRTEILYRHRFSTPGKRKRFLDWFSNNASSGVSQRLIDLAVAAGTAKVAVILEDIAAGRITDEADIVAA